MARRDDSKFSTRLEDAAKARAEMLAKAKARVEAAKEGAEERNKERLAVAAAREERQKQRAEEKRLAAIEAEKNKAALEEARKKAEEEAKLAAAKAAEEAIAQKAEMEAAQKAARDAKYAARKERGKKKALAKPVRSCRQPRCRQAPAFLTRYVRKKSYASADSSTIISPTGMEAPMRHRGCAAPVCPYGIDRHINQPRPEIDLRAQRQDLRVVPGRQPPFDQNRHGEIDKGLAEIVEGAQQPARDFAYRRRRFIARAEIVRQALVFGRH